MYHLPAELPIDCSKYFSTQLLRILPPLLNSNYPSDIKEVEKLPEELRNGTETWGGKLSPKYSYLYNDLSKQFSEYKNIRPNM